MGAKVTFDYSKAAEFIRENEMASFEQIANSAKEVLVSRSGQGNDFLGWIDLPVDYDKEEFARIKEAAKQIQSDSEVLLVIGIGGSYLARARRSNFSVMASTITLQRSRERLRKFISLETAFPAAISRG